MDFAIQGFLGAADCSAKAAGSAPPVDFQVQVLSAGSSMAAG